MPPYKKNLYAQLAAIALQNAAKYATPYITRNIARQYSSAAQRSGRTGKRSGSVSLPRQSGTKRFKRSNKKMTVSALRLKKNVGAAYSKSAGFIRKPRMSTRARKTQRKGEVYTVESGAVQTPSFCGYIGHSTVPRTYAVRVACAAIVKRLHELISCSYTDSNDLAFGGDSTLNRIRYLQLTYKNAQNAASTTVTYTSTASSTVDDVVSWLYNEITSIYGQYNTVLLENIRLLQADSAGNTSIDAMIYLKDTKVTLISKSTLKLQNRSKNALGSEADEVDNVPLYGKQYSGTGNGTLHIKQGITTEMSSAPADGIIYFSGDSSPYLREPPLGPEFVNATTYGKVKIDPGEIKTSVISSYLRKPINEYFSQLIYVNPVVTETRPRYKLGKFRLYALEKMIETSNSEPIAMTLAYENNTRLECMITQYRPGFQTMHNFLL